MFSLKLLPSRIPGSSWNLLGISTPNSGISVFPATFFIFNVGEIESGLRMLGVPCLRFAFGTSTGLEQLCSEQNLNGHFQDRRVIDDKN